MLRDLFETGRGYIREYALKNITDYAFAGDGAGVSRWRKIREAVTTGADIAERDRKSDIQNALAILTNLRTMPHDSR